MVVEISVILMNIMPGVYLFRAVFRYYSLP